jgi:hypothetical protein
MTKSKFTEGPYRVSNSFEGGDRELWIYSDTTYLGSVANSSMDPQEIAANAELWADAPRMLEVLRKVLTYSEPLLGWQHIDEAEQAFGDANDLLEKHCG